MASAGRVLEETGRSELPIPIRFVAIARRVMRDLDAALEPTGLKPRHVKTLMALRARPCAQGDLVLQTDVDPTKLVGVLNDLERAGLIARKRDPGDRRRHTVTLSARGHAKLETVDAATRAVEERLVSGLDDAQRAHLDALLAHIATNAGESRC